MKREGWLTYVTLIPVVTSIIIASGDGVSGTNFPIPADWNWTYNFQELRKGVEDGHDLGAPNGLLFNRLGPVHYDANHSHGNTNFLTANVEPDMHLNFRIQNHNLVLVETEGSYTDFDIHVGQSYSFLVAMDQDASSDYYVVASPWFVNSSSGGRVIGVAALHYTNFQGPTSSPLPDLPSDTDPCYFMNQEKSIRLLYSANPLSCCSSKSSRAVELIDGKWHATLNGLSYFTPSTPLTMAQLYKLSRVYKLDFPSRSMNRPSRLDTSLTNSTYKSFVEIILKYYGIWTENSRSTYNKDDAVARCTIQ
ncbi:Monocopper oxidase-like protein SKS1, partial [Bienertia sinuspersici]